MPRSTASALWTGSTAGSTAACPQAERRRPFASKCGRQERAQARGRVAIVIADNLRTHTEAGSRLVRQMLAELQGKLYLVYTPAYDPDANRIEWLWRISRRAVSHNHQRETWLEVQADIVQHFALLRQRPDEVLRHLGSAFAEHRPRTPQVACAA